MDQSSEREFSIGVPVEANLVCAIIFLMNEIIVHLADGRNLIYKELSG